MVPTDANFTGNVFGGTILAEVDKVAYVSAPRHAGTVCVTACVTTSFDRVDFLAPVHVGQGVEFDACRTYVGRTSMEVSVEIRSEQLIGGERRLVGNAHVTMVGVDSEGMPTRVLPLHLTTEAERRRFEDGSQQWGLRRRTLAGRSGPRPRDRGTAGS